MVYLNESHLSMVRHILRECIPDRKVFVFGSRATGKIKPHSDLDLCILGSRPISLKKMAILKEKFSESDLPMRVDVVDWTTISPEFQAVISQHAEKLQK